MRITVKILSGLLIMACLAANTLAAPPEAEITGIEADGTEKPGNLQAAIDKLNSDIQEFLFLSEKIDSADEINRDVLVYRLDVRSFRLLKDFEAVIEPGGWLSR